MCYIAHKSIRQDNCFGLALLLVYKIFEQYNNNNNNSNGNNNKHYHSKAPLNSFQKLELSP